jgi:prepilin-type N-terminal cleavage/methylation domain-containing protein
MVKIKRSYKKRKGFSLIEVIIALSILMIAVLALELSYYSYYRNVTDLRIKTIGQDLAQLQLEDIQNLAASVIANDIIDSTTGYPPNYPPDQDPTENVYSSGKIGGEFKIGRLTDIVLLDSDGNPHDFKNGADTVDGIGLNSLLMLPRTIAVEPQDVYGDGTPDHYILTLHKEVFPNYKKRIVITDETPTVKKPYKKIFNIQVTVYWDVNGVEKSVTIEGEKK